MFARTEQHGHYQIEFYDPAGVALLIVSSTDGKFNAKGNPNPYFDSAHDSLQSQGYLPTGDDVHFEVNSEHFVIMAWSREAQVAPQYDLMRELSAEVAASATRRLVTT